MKKIIIPALLILVLLGCSSEGDIKIINRTDHNLYFTIKGVDYVLAGSESSDPFQEIEIDTGKQFLFWGDDVTKVHMAMEGETFMMQDSYSSGLPNGLYHTETYLYVKPDETTKIYCSATHAGVKVINNSAETVQYLQYFTDDSDTLKTLNDSPIFGGEEFWSRLKATSDYDSITYSFVIQFADGSVDSTYSNIDDLVVDEQLLIELN
ncbi:MAG TPA: hypothetical protein PLD62_04925 [Candidatus Cloacimonadota bacterium]|nr:hypothetical protein [Candidatus Cloacimonadota bacterium]